MIVVITTSIVATVMVLLGKFHKPLLWMKIGFIFVTFIGCIHYNFGNDYISYYYIWESIRGLSLNDIMLVNNTYYDYNDVEIGWKIINLIFEFDNGFYWMIALINLIEGVIYYKFIKRFVPNSLFFLSFILYIFTYKFYLLNFSMMRQGFAMALVLLSFIYFCEKRYILMSAIITVALSIHMSAIIVVPFFVLCKFVEKINTRILVAIIVFFSCFLYLALNYTEYLFTIVMSMNIFEKYAIFYVGDKTKENYGMAFLFFLIPYITMIYFMVFKSEKITKEDKYLIVLSIVALLLRPFEVVGAQLISRIGYYFSAFGIAIVPVLYSRINNPIIKAMLYISLMTITFYSYIMFYEDPVYKDYFLEFHSVFEL